MRYWNTKDAPTNANLAWLESLGASWPQITVEHFVDRIRAVIEVERMLPKAVRAHFTFPHLYIGASADHWSDNMLRERVAEFCSAINAGLDRVEADSSLKRDGDADLSDRPATRGEELHAAVEAYQDYRGSTELSNLWTAIQGTGLRYKMEQLERWLVRKRPSPGGPSIEYEIVSVLGDIGRGARDYHHVPASYDFQERNSRKVTAL